MWPFPFAIRRRSSTILRRMHRTSPSTSTQQAGSYPLSSPRVLKAEDLEVYTMEVEETKTKKEEE